MLNKISLARFLASFILLFMTADSFSTESSAIKSLSKVEKQTLAKTILSNKSLKSLLDKSNALVKTGFNAGDGYGEVWIRDFNTFIELSCDVIDHQKIKDNLLMFFRFQGDDGNIIDGFIPKEKAGVGYDYIKKGDISSFAAHKNTVETDQESSLIQAVYLYVNKTGDKSILEDNINGKTVLQRMAWAMDFLLTKRYSEKYGLLWGATTSDWGDVQPEHDWGVVIDENTHRAIDIYDNAMFAIAISNYISMLPADNDESAKWKKTLKDIKANVRQHLWDAKRQKYIPHIYLDDSPFPKDFNELEIFYHGGSAVAIQAGFMTKPEIAVTLQKMIDNVKKSGAGSIGLTVYPPYPAGFYKNKGMGPYSYQNGGDWTWFGGRMIQGLIQHGFIKEAYEQLIPMMERVHKNNGFYEWYSVKNEPRGSGSFRGSAGVLGKSVQMLYQWAEANSAE